MKRFLLIVIAILSIFSMVACSLPFPVAQPQILLNGEEIEAMEIEMGQKTTLSSNLTKNITWSSSDDSIVKVTSVGALFALKEGTVTVTLTSGSKTDSITVTVTTKPTIWTIGDSIFDFNDNGDDSPIYSMVDALGYTNSYMDNIGGSTIYPSKGNGNSILEHISSGMYTDFENAYGDPELIVIFRGTNDVGWHVSDPKQYTFLQIEESIHHVCNHFSTNYPDARIVWATPIWRLGIEESIMDNLRELLHTICPQYGIEVFDLHLTEPFVSLNNDNYSAVLYDGIHPNLAAAIQMKDSFVNYINGK